MSLLFENENLFSHLGRKTQLVLSELSSEKAPPIFIFVTKSLSLTYEHVCRGVIILPEL